MHNISRFGKLFLALGFLLAALGLAFHAVRAKNQADASGPVTIYLETPLSAKEPQAFRGMADGMAFTAWGEMPDVTVTDPDLGRRVETDALVLDGPSELVLPLAPVLPQGDTDGCLIGEETAWELFGSTQVTGDRICIGNETRIIRGVVNLPQSGVVFEGVKGIAETGTEEDGGVYDRITVGGGKAEDAEAFLVQNGLDGKILRLDYLSGLHWLTELIPGKWSDFPGWKNNFTQKKEDFGLLFQINKNSIEIYFMRQCFLYIRDMVLEAVCAAGVLVCFTGFIKNRRTNLLRDIIKPGRRKKQD